MLKKINKDKFIQCIRDLCITANYKIEPDVFQAYEERLKVESSELGREILQQIIENARLAKDHDQPLCQDTGFAVFFLEVGRDAYCDFDLEEAINEGVRRGYKDGYLRESILKDPLSRVNTGDNTPAVVHLRIVPGDSIKITIAPKGGGAENMSQLKMLAPSDGVAGVKQFVVDVVKKAGANACPPLIVGVGIGGTFEKAAILAKESLLREIGSIHQDKYYVSLEQELFNTINELGIGPMGLGGKTTALAVFIKTYPCHLASLPVAVNIQCHSARHKSIIIEGYPCHDE